MVAAKKHLLVSIGSLALIASLLTGCGSASSSDDEETPTSLGSLANVTGSIRGLSGVASEMSGWVMVFVERDTGIARVSEIGPIGTYAINGLAGDKVQTALLLDPSYRLSSVIASPSDNATQLRQFFHINTPIIPTLVQRGPVINFADTKGITWEKDTCFDTNSDGIPDGMSSAPFISKLAGASRLVGSEANQSYAAASESDASGNQEWGNGEAAAQSDHKDSDSQPAQIAASTNIDTDNDGIANGAGDPDIDGDGIINGFDSDINGNGVLNIFDPDANGDAIADSTQTNGELYYKLGLEYGFVQVVQQVKSGALNTQLVFTAKVRSDFKDASVTVRGPTSLLDSALAQTTNPDSGAITTSPWDKSLLDDGANQDGTAKDLIYARSVVLADGKSLKGNQVLFIDLTRKVGSVPVSLSFPYTFPAITTGPVGASYNATTRVFTRTGTPFVGISDYRWSVHIFDPTGKKVFSSEAILGTTGTYTLPSNLLDPTVKYTAVVYAQSLDRIASYPAWVIKSENIAL